MTKRDQDRYDAACHAMQSGVAADHQGGSDDGSPKHLRVGVNSALVSVAATGRLLIGQGRDHDGRVRGRNGRRDGERGPRVRAAALRTARHEGDPLVTTMTGLAAGIDDATRYATGPTTRVRLDGPGNEPGIRAALTRVWRLVGQPITVLVPMHRDPVGDVAAAWAAEHALAGVRVEHLVSEFGPPCVVVPADGPVPWCGCVHPPCGRCLAVAS